MLVTINFLRPGKGTTRYIEGFVDENPVRLKTFTSLSSDFSLKWCEELWWKNGFIPRGILVGSVTKYIFYHEWFSVMVLCDPDGNLLGHYVDIDTPMRKVGEEYYFTDLFLDLWIAPDGSLVELDWDEFEAGFGRGLITPRQYKKAIHTFNLLKKRVSDGEFMQLIG